MCHVVICTCLSKLPVHSNTHFNKIFTPISDLSDGGEVTVADFYRTAKEICATPNTDQPFMCLDVSYMAVLLEEGYGLKPQTKIKVRK